MRTVAIVLSILFLSSSALAKGPDADAGHAKPGAARAHATRPSKAKKAKPKKAAAHKKKTTAHHPQKKKPARAMAKKAPLSPKK